MPTGRPLKFQNPVELQKKIDAYFKKCDKDGEPYTITGLALDLDTSRQTLLEYEGEVQGRDNKDPMFADTIKRAKHRVENYAERMLFKIRPTGPIFALKNFGWRDESTQTLVIPKPLDDLSQDYSVRKNKGNGSPGSEDTSDPRGDISQ